MNLIAAVDRNWAIGNRGELLARVRGDMRHFAAVTTGHTVILGANTLATFPGGRPLKNRRNIILSTRLASVEGAEVVRSVPELLELAADCDPAELFVIGGASVYSQLLPFCDTAYITKFDRSFEFDRAIPDLDADPEWYCVYRGPDMVSDGNTDTESGMRYWFATYKRVKR